jgi:hypothetical protein
MHHFSHRMAPAMALALPLLAAAQPKAEATDPKAAAAPLRYQSAFADYRPWQDIKPGNWRELNDNLLASPTANTGHAGHGAASPAPAASVPPAHPGHHRHGGQR